ncbi:MAG: hypothetical protein LN566_01585 [Rickettsia endosymbiont of Stiretrus anchorago]|nr:hypothetical protein [Rickettsia endosymbiont of Stiretrus anchorago]
MSRLTINNSNNNLGPITIDNSQCMFTLTTPSCFINNSTVIYNNSNGLNHTKISYDNGITVETSSNKININGFGDSIEFESYSGSATINVGAEVVIISNNGDPITTLTLNDGFNSNTLTLNNQCLYLENIFVNSNTIFNNSRIGSKIGTIYVSKDKSFDQTENDLAINELKLASEAKIKFTHDGSNYKFINPTPSSSNDVVIRNLHNIAADAKNINNANLG